MCFAAFIYISLSLPIVFVLQRHCMKTTENCMVINNLIFNLTPLKVLESMSSQTSAIIIIGDYHLPPHCFRQISLLKKNK